MATEITLQPGWLEREFNSEAVRIIRQQQIANQQVQAIYDEFNGNARMMAIIIRRLRKQVASKPDAAAGGAGCDG